MEGNRLCAVADGLPVKPASTRHFLVFFCSCCPHTSRYLLDIHHLSPVPVHVACCLQGVCFAGESLPGYTGLVKAPKCTS
jgi:hypothetical protein